MEKERLNKYLASCGICSRREADRLILEGRVTVNGKKAETGMQVGEEDKILVNEKPVHGKNEKVVLAFYKPVGVICTEKDKFEAMMRGGRGHEKEYIVKVNKEVTEEFLNKMSGGIFLPELNITTKPCKTEKVGKFTFKIILTQGVNRQIRRMTKELGYHVNAIKRIRVVNILLADLKPGQYRQIGGQELHALYNFCLPDQKEKMNVNTKYSMK